MTFHKQHYILFIFITCMQPPVYCVSSHKICWYKALLSMISAVKWFTALSKISDLWLVLCSYSAHYRWLTFKWRHQTSLAMWSQENLLGTHFSSVYYFVIRKWWLSWWKCKQMKQNPNKQNFLQQNGLNAGFSLCMFFLPDWSFGIF